MAIADIQLVLNQDKTEIETSVGKLVPIFSFDPDGRKKEAAPAYYASGEIKSVPLEEATLINTSIGVLPAELVTFYKNGKLRRLFPLNGRINAYWTEADEYSLAETFDISAPSGKISVKPIYLQFYETGELHSICFWPGERIKLETPAGLIDARKGVSFHINGRIACCEPSYETLIKTPIGNILAYDPDPEGISASDGALCFDSNGRISSLLTIKNCIVFGNGRPGERVYSPKVVQSYCDESASTVVPMRIEFYENSVTCLNRSGKVLATDDTTNITVRKWGANE